MKNLIIIIIRKKKKRIKGNNLGTKFKKSPRVFNCQVAKLFGDKSFAAPTK